MDDASPSSEWSQVSRIVSFPYRGREWSRVNSSASFITVVVRRVSFPQTWSSIFVITGMWRINQPRIDVEEVNPNFVMATFDLHA